MIQQATHTGVFEVDASIYSIIAVLLGLAGVWLARLVTTNDENRKLGRKQTAAETLPLTLVGVLIVCPIIFHYQIAIPWASLMGLGVGYSVRLLLKMLGGGAAEAMRAFLRGGVKAIDDAPPTPLTPHKMLDAPHSVPPAVIMPPDGLPSDQQSLLRRLDDIPDSPGGRE